MDNKFHVLQKVIFYTTRSDMMNFNGRTCWITDINEDGSYVISFDDPTMVVFEDELLDEVKE